MSVDVPLALHYPFQRECRSHAEFDSASVSGKSIERVSDRQGAATRSRIWWLVRPALVESPGDTLIAIEPGSWHPGLRVAAPLLGSGAPQS